MRPASAELPRDLLVAREAALRAWLRIASLRHAPDQEVVEKPDGPTGPADLLADATIRDVILERLGPQAFLTEETADTPERLSADRVWIVDPIDGTRDFLSGGDDFTIQVACVSRPAPNAPMRPVAAAVYAPAYRYLLLAAEDFGAFEESLPEDPNAPLEDPSPASWRRLTVVPNAHLTQCTAVVSRNHTTRRLHAVLEALPLGRVLRRGSLGIKMGEVARGRADLYILTERGAAKEWDSCAPHLVLEQAGGRVTDMEGAPVDYNCAQVRLMGGLVATNGHCHAPLLEALRGVPALWAP